MTNNSTVEVAQQISNQAGDHNGIPHNLFLLVALLADGDADRGSLQAKHLTNLVFQIPLIGEVEKAGIITENDEVRRLGAGLGHIVDLQAATLIRRRLNTSSGIRQNTVQRTGGDAAGILGMDILDHLVQFVHSLTG